MNVKIEESWKAQLQKEFGKPYFDELTAFVRQEYANKKVYPPAGLIFNAFDKCPFNEVKVVIVGQDPYHEPGQAHGLCFSVSKGIQPPPSLVNIFKELNDDIGLSIPKHGNLEKWANQGVLLLNATLTVRANQAGSHQKRGWENFTDAAIMALSAKRSGIVFILWGAYAQAKAQIIDKSKHHILMGPHPSPLSVHRGFFGCKHFSKTNQLLTTMAKEPVDWNLD